MTILLKGADDFTSVATDGITAQSISKVISAESYMVIDSAVDTNIGSVGDFSLVITPKFNNSRFLVDILWNGEVSIPWNTMFNVMRDGARINLPGKSGVGRGIGVTTDPYHNDFSSTIGRCHIVTLDTIGSTVGVPITYQLTGIGWSAIGCYTNRTATNVATNEYEHATSHMRITEFKT